MWEENLREQIVDLQSPCEKGRLEEFLNKQDLKLDQDVEYSIALYKGEKIVATGSFSGRVLKSIAVDDEHKNAGLSARILTGLLREEYERGRTHLFIYTKPENRSVFSELGFYTIAQVPSRVILMENRPEGIKNYLAEISKEKAEGGGISAAVVVNCNPFTLGHKYLIEYAASRCEKLHIFVLWEERSVFPAELRYSLIKEGVGHLPNVVLHKGGNYIISAATFPSYFIKEYQEQVETHARLDLEVFSKYIVPTLGISKRFVGDEPYCEVTAAYNRIMQEVLPACGVGVEVVPRLTYDGLAVSASRVRELIRMNKIDEVKGLVPESTYRFLLSSEAQEIIKHIQLSYQ
ncbi:MAG TPA: [citrate (pro-3S)-lyase] ligase, partial [Firmicutes bacterium]|nr:[citrate (pro-3S)-lyase] ligase [Bacillota bacterium]